MMTALSSPLITDRRQATRAHERMVETARAAGMPADQLKNFLRAGYIPQPMQMRAHAAARACDRADGPTMVGVGGSRGPGKSHWAFGQVALDDCQRQERLKVLYLRKVGKNAREQFEDLRSAVLRFTPHDYHRVNGVVTFKNGSRVMVGHFHTENDVDQYLGLEYDGVVIEEATSLTVTKIRAIRDSNRTSKPTWRPRIYLTTNPGGVGHAYFKQTFIAPWKERREGDTRFIFGTVDDNVFIDPGYRKKLEENTGWRLRAYRYGDWDIAAGQFFTNFSEARHVVDWFRAPSDWRVWLAMDYGMAHYNTIYMCAQSNDGVVWILDEHAERGWLVPQHAEALGQMLVRNDVGQGRIEKFVAGGDVFATSDSGSTIAARWLTEGWTLTPANTARVDGAAEIMARLGNEARPPTLRMTRRCQRLIECLPTLQHDPNRPEDVLKVDLDEEGLGGDDPYDGARFGVMEAARPAQAAFSARN